MKEGSLSDKISHWEDQIKRKRHTLEVEDAREAVKKLDWDKDDYDYVKQMLETAYGADVDRRLWEHCFKLTCLALKIKRDRIFGEALVK